MPIATPHNHFHEVGHTLDFEPVAKMGHEIDSIPGSDTEKRDEADAVGL